MSDEEKQLYVCTEAGFPSPYDDNVNGPCENNCGKQIQWRPYAPPNVFKVCAKCAKNLVDLHKSAGGKEPEVVILKQTLNEINDYLQTTKH